MLAFCAEMELSFLKKGPVSVAPTDLRAIKDKLSSYKPVYVHPDLVLRHEQFVAAHPELAEACEASVIGKPEVNGPRSAGQSDDLARSARDFWQVQNKVVRGLRSHTDRSRSTDMEIARGLSCLEKLHEHRPRTTSGAQAESNAPLQAVPDGAIGGSNIKGRSGLVTKSITCPSTADAPSCASPSGTFRIPQASLSQTIWRSMHKIQGEVVGDVEKIDPNQIARMYGSDRPVTSNLNDISDLTERVPSPEHFSSKAPPAASEWQMPPEDMVVEAARLTNSAFHSIAERQQKQIVRARARIASVHKSQWPPPGVNSTHHVGSKFKA